MRLSRKGWNNVLIFGVLIIIFIFNFSHKLRLSSDIQQRAVIRNDLTIVEIKTPDFKVIRAGRTWKSEPDLGLSKQQLASLVENWQNLELETRPAIKTDNSAYPIAIYTSKQEQPISVLLLQQGDDYLLQIDSSTSLFLSAQQLPLLLGR